MDVSVYLVFLVFPLLVGGWPNGYDKEYFREFFGAMSWDLPALRDIPASKGCRNCPKVYYPICGDDNVTYINECRMTCYNENRNKGPKARFVRTGPCEVFPEFDK